MNNLELLFSTILLLIANNTDGATENDNNLTSTSTELALKSIREAQFAGADVSDAVRSFNMALDLIEQAGSSESDSCSSYEDCSEQALTILLNLTDDTHMLKEKAVGMASLQKLMNLIVYTPLLAFAASVVGYCSFRGWKAHTARKFLEMQIEVKGK